MCKLVLSQLHVWFISFSFESVPIQSCTFQFKAVSYGYSFPLKVSDKSLHHDLWVLVQSCTTVRFVSFNAKFDICTVVAPNEKLLEAKIRTWDQLGTLECAYSNFSFKKCAISIHEGANAKLSIKWDETDYNDVSVVDRFRAVPS